MIPKKLHFITGLKEDFGGKPFVFAHYMAVRSALSVNPGFRAYVYFQYEPSGPYWDLIKPDVECVRVEAPHEIFGNKLDHFAHKTDVLRLQILLREGGVYMDFDTLCQKSFEPLFGDRVVMGMESHKTGIEQLAQGSGFGLCNALIIAPPNARFLEIWLDSFRKFDQSNWAHHAVFMPQLLSREHPDLVQIEPPERFFWPSWHGQGIQSLFAEAHDFPEAVSMHLWESLSWPYLSALDIDAVLNEDTSYNRIARRFVQADRAGLERAQSSSHRISNEMVRERFNAIYRDSVWGAGSGSGSTPANTLEYRHFLSKFMVRNGIQSVLDFGCGDWQFSQYIDWSDVNYYGVDIVESVIIKNRARFQTSKIDFTIFSDFDELPKVDLIICKDVLQHLSNEQARRYVSALRRKCRLLLITNDINPANAVNSQITEGGWRPVRPDLAPFSLPAGVVFDWDIHDVAGTHRKATYLVYGMA
jgi:2-polyprenyl-3-methyl-5-hydroxy-6-metoxy-1,4-benzoquinol methylase